MRPGRAHCSRWAERIAVGHKEIWNHWETNIVIDRFTRFRRAIGDQKPLCGSWIVMDSPLAAEIAGAAGFDWLLLDLEHGMMGFDRALTQMIALGHSSAVPMVRVPSLDEVQIKRVLDLGPGGIMAPQVRTAEEASGVVRAMRYPPEGLRGASPYTRAAAFGPGFPEYFAKANDALTCWIQVETREAVENASAIAAVDGVDVLFVGPFDLSVGLGIPRQFEDPRFQDALDHVVTAAHEQGKAAGILTLDVDTARKMTERGFTVVGIGGDAPALAAALHAYASGYKEGLG